MSRSPSASLSAPAPLLRGGMSVRRYFALHLHGALFLFLVAMLLYGWRGLLVLGGVVLSTLAGLLLWRRIGARGRQINLAHGLWFALLLGFMLPVRLAHTGPSPINPAVLWPLIPAAGLTLAALIWLLGSSGRIHPILICYLLLVVLFRVQLIPHYVLQRGHLAIGDAFNAAVDRPFPYRQPWITAGELPGRDAIYWQWPASEQLSRLTSFGQSIDQSQLTLPEVLRDQMPPLEDLIIAGHPGPIGAGSAIAVIIGGLFLLYRGLIDYRIPLLIVLFMYAGLLCLPMPVSIANGLRHWHGFVWQHSGVGWSVILTFANYELMAGPTLFMAFFLATAGGIRPMTGRGRIVYAAGIGVLTAVCSVYFSVSFGPYLALLLVSLGTPLLDRMFKPHPLI